MSITCQILHPSGFGRWRSPTSRLCARLVHPGLPSLIRAVEADDDGALPELLPEESDHPSLWLGDGVEGVTLTRTYSGPPITCPTIWSIMRSVGEDPLFGSMMIAASELEDRPDDLAVYLFADPDPDFIRDSIELLELSWGELLARSVDEDAPGTIPAPVLAIATARSRGELDFAQARATRWQKLAAASANHSTEVQS